MFLVKVPIYRFPIWPHCLPYKTAILLGKGHFAIFRCNCANSSNRKRDYHFVFIKVPLKDYSEGSTNCGALLNRPPQIQWFIKIIKTFYKCIFEQWLAYNYYDFYKLHSDLGQKKEQPVMQTTYRILWSFIKSYHL